MVGVVWSLDTGLAEQAMSGSAFYGRQTLGRKFYPEPVITLILERVTVAVAAGRPIAEVFDDPALPCRASFYAWLADDDELRSRFDAARAAGSAAKKSLTV